MTPSLLSYFLLALIIQFCIMAICYRTGYNSSTYDALKRRIEDEDVRNSI